MVRNVDILCVGNVVVDAVGTGVDAFPEEGSLALFDKVELHIGGCPANTALALAKLDVRAGFAGKVGRDGLGAFVVSVMEAHGVDLRGLQRSTDPRESTSFSFIVVPRSGDRRILHTLGCNATLGPADVERRLFRGPRWIAFEGLSLLPGLFGKNLARLLAAAHRAGAHTAADTALNNRLRSWEPVFKGCWEHLDVFFPSEEEARRIAGNRSPRAMCQMFHDRGVKIAGVKLGARGCALLAGEGYREIPAYRVRCVDTLGAGDCFMAGFLTGLLKGRSPFEAARLGNATSAFCIQAVGATTGIPKLAVVEKFMRSARTR